MKKQEFLALMKSERTRFEQCLSVIGQERMNLAGVSGDYSVVDILAHLEAYERALVTWLTEAKEGRVYIDPLVDQKDLDARNDVIFQQNRGRDVAGILAQFRRTLDELEQAVEELSEEELTDAELSAWYVVPRWGYKQELWKCIANDSYEHHQQHLEDMERWLEQENHI